MVSLIYKILASFLVFHAIVSSTHIEEMIEEEDEEEEEVQYVGIYEYVQLICTQIAAAKELLQITNSSIKVDARRGYDELHLLGQQVFESSQRYLMASHLSRRLTSRARNCVNDGFQNAVTSHMFFDGNLEKACNLAGKYGDLLTSYYVDLTHIEQPAYNLLHQIYDEILRCYGNDNEPACYAEVHWWAKDEAEFLANVLDQAHSLYRTVEDDLETTKLSCWYLTVKQLKAFPAIIANIIDSCLE